MKESSPFGEEVYFWPDSPVNLGRFNDNNGQLDEAIRSRANTLFGSLPVLDPLDRTKANKYWGAEPSYVSLDVASSDIDMKNISQSSEKTPNVANNLTLAEMGLGLQIPKPRPRPKPPERFKLNPSEFLQRARMMPPTNPKASASGFAQWVYSLYGSAYGNEKDMLNGKEVEPDILDRRRNAAKSVNNSFLQNIKSDWELIHVGLHEAPSDTLKYFEIEHLPVNGRPLKASPDLIYHNKHKSELIIVEIKYSRLPITTNLWPNVWAQLWCYSQLEIARTAKKLTVVGEVWGERWISLGRRKHVKTVPILCLRASVHRDPRAPAYNKFFSELFSIYSGNG
ncbi:hypothetical protein [Methylophaga thalassica]|uniref:hypothetical protein n=1 Tax=Methylophaga thalassica TaxID=40223 RepID=UPI002E7BE66D|nr:hypothetical protein [Methylophaga thalassica]WVI84921.1 hypothetical protein VSX76_14220 [Methylophaga thalassica]